MTSISLRSCVLAVFALVLCGVASAVTDVRYTPRIKLNVVGSEASLNLAQSYLGRELRKLPDVSVVESEPDYVVNVLVLDTRTKGGQSTGVAISVVVLQPIDQETIVKIAQPTKRELATYLSNEQHAVLKHWIQVGAETDLERICAEIVATIDSEVIEPERIQFRQITEAMEKKANAPAKK